MSDPTPPEPGDADERLGAWLDGDLTDAQADAVAAEIAADPELTARLEAIREVRERLAGSATAHVTDGFTERVGRAVAAEADAAPHDEPPPPTVGAERAGADPVSLDRARVRRDRRRRRLVAAGSVAAAVVAVAVLAPLVGDLTPNGQDAAEIDLAEGDGRTDAGEARTTDDRASSDEDAALEAQDAAPSDQNREDSRAVGVPRVVDEQRAFADPDALVEHAADRPEAIELLGTPPRRAQELAEATAAAVRRADPFADGTDPAACLNRITRQVDGPAVIAHVERLILDGETLTAHLVVSAAPNTALETVTLQVRDPDADCAARLTRRLR